MVRLQLEIILPRIAGLKEQVLNAMHNSRREGAEFRFSDIELFELDLNNMKVQPLEFNVASGMMDFGQRDYHMYGEEPDYEIRAQGIPEVRAIESMPSGQVRNRGFEENRELRMQVESLKVQLEKAPPKLPAGSMYSDDEGVVYIYHTEHGWLEYDEFIKELNRVEVVFEIVDVEPVEIDEREFRDGFVSGTYQVKKEKLDWKPKQGNFLSTLIDSGHGGLLHKDSIANQLRTFR
jgi:hypothetical protein